MKLRRAALLPISFLLNTVLTLRHLLYDRNVLKSQTNHDLATICVGNLSFGGTGKTPFTELLIKLLGDGYKLAVLSRGYGRATKGYKAVAITSTASEVGDEPLQIKRKFEKVAVAVDENRVSGLKRLYESVKPDVVILDDAFQHRKVKPGFNILLTTYDKPYPKDHLFPAGGLRDSKKQARRADFIVVTKCPLNLSAEQRKKMTELLRPEPHQKVFFAALHYGDLIPLNDENGKTRQLENDTRVLLVTGIADTRPIEGMLIERNCTYQHLAFRDHHSFSSADLTEVQRIFDNFVPSIDLIITTEKDAMRLKSSTGWGKLKDLPFYYLEMEMRLMDRENQMKQEIEQYVSRSQSGC